jgi:tetratricopeptide (TPR) repeat protein
MAIKIDSKKLSGYIGLGDCCRIEGEFLTAIQNYSTVLKQDDSVFEIIGLKRAICYIELKQYDLAEEDINRILEVNNTNCEAMYFKGLIAFYKNNFTQAVITYEQAITLNNSQTATIKSLHDIAIIRIKECDIYAAYYTLDRVEEIPETVSNLHNLKIFLEGAVNMIKKKFKLGLECMEKLSGSGNKFSDKDVSSSDVKKDQFDRVDINENIKPLILSYKAFGLFSLGKIPAAHYNYRLLEEMGQIASGDVYNKYLCEGILAARSFNFDTALEKFESAQALGKIKIEPPFYIWMMSIMRVVHENKDALKKFLAVRKRKLDAQTDEKLKKKLVLVVYEALEHLEKVLAENNSCSNLSFYIGYLKLAIGLENEAVENFNTAIDKSDDNQALHYLWKGIALCMCQTYDQALNEFRTALSIDPEDYQAALHKGRCYLYKKDIEKAFYAFKDFMNGKEEEREIKYWLGNFFFSNGLNSHAN